MTPAASYTLSGVQPKFLSVFRCAVPAMIVAVLLLAPFVNTPFTIDDPIFLKEAQHVLLDPLHPQAFDLVWDADIVARPSEVLPGGIAAPYLLIPAALAGCSEVAAHLTTLFFLLLALFGAAAAAVRLGLSYKAAGMAALLVAVCPAVLGMSGTVMPDIPAMAFATLGMERVMAWREGRRWPAATLATLWLALAALTRVHTSLLLIPACVFLLDGLTADEIRSSFVRFPMRFAPIVMVPIVYVVMSAITADPEMVAENILSASLLVSTRLRAFFSNGVAFLAHWTLAVPFSLPWLVLRARALSNVTIAAGLVIAGAFSLRAGWASIAAGVSVVVLLDVIADAWNRRDRVQTALWLWLWIAIPIVVYVHLPAKYLLPSAPAAALLIVRLAAETSDRKVRWLIPATLGASAILGVLILIGIRDLARIQRQAVTDLIVPRIEHGERVLFAGHWGFQWYAEHAGAAPATLEPTTPVSGDIIVASMIDRTIFLRKWSARRVIETKIYPGNGIGVVMDANSGAGFFSNPWGYWPWIWGRGSANRYEVWEVE